MRTYYDILGITQKAPPEIIVAVYRAWMHALKAHPDLGGDEEFARSLNAAYETLKDDDKRAKYDSKLESFGVAPKDEVRRRSKRVEVNREIAFCIPPDGGWLPAETIDASSLGLKLRTKEELLIGMHVSIAFPNNACSTIEAVVRWSKPVKDQGAWRGECGIEFFAPVPDILKKL